VVLYETREKESSMAGDLATLDDIGRVLEGAGYVLERAELAGMQALLAESAYALVGCVELADWTDFSQHVSDAQAALTRVAGEARSVCSSEVYLVLHVRSMATDTIDYAALQAAETDTRRTRTLVRAAVRPSALDRALRPLLPLCPGAVFDLVEPLRQLRDELRELALEDRVADTAIEAFREQNEVRVP
jgi:hypothetical protein